MGVWIRTGLLQGIVNLLVSHITEKIIIDYFHGGGVNRRADQRFVVHAPQLDMGAAHGVGADRSAYHDPTQLS